MTRIKRELTTCRLCATERRQTVLLSSNTFAGAAGLDGRPGGMLGLSMEFWVQRCPRCGYCATDLSRDSRFELPVVPVAGYDGIWAGPEHLVPDLPPRSVGERGDSLESVVQSNRYRAQLHNLFFPKLANSFLCQSLLNEAEGRYVDATFAALHAAWVCEDAMRFKRARQCRARVLAMIQKASAASQYFGFRLRSQAAILVDALRRTGDFDSAAATCKEALVDQPDELLRNVLQFQLALINRRSKAARSVADAVRWSQKA
jgi:hypothetical protein